MFSFYFFSRNQISSITKKPNREPNPAPTARRLGPIHRGYMWSDTFSESIVDFHSYCMGTVSASNFFSPVSNLSTCMSHCHHQRISLGVCIFYISTVYIINSLHCRTIVDGWLACWTLLQPPARLSRLRGTACAASSGRKAVVAAT
jgi:hypothetical protein